ncbi:MAG TPA: urease accessory protein UreE [Xanthobacteraceae bacterium]
MPRVTKVLRTGDARAGRATDTLMLDYDQRQAQQGFFFTGKGTCVAFDFAEPPALATDDMLVLDDGALIDVVAETEALIEARISDPAVLARTTWVLGNRHVPVKIFANRLRLRRNAEAEALLAAIGAKTVMLVAPFEPDGASQHGDHAHHHGHAHEHHDHEHHDHEHHGHDHDDRKR